MYLNNLGAFSIMKASVLKVYKSSRSLLVNTFFPVLLSITKMFLVSISYSPFIHPYCLILLSSKLVEHLTIEYDDPASISDAVMTVKVEFSSLPDSCALDNSGILLNFSIHHLKRVV